MYDGDGWVPNPPVFVGESVRASLVLDSDGEPYYLKTKKNPIGFNLKKKGTNNGRTNIRECYPLRCGSQEGPYTI